MTHTSPNSSTAPLNTDATKPRQLGRSSLHTLPLALDGKVFGWTVDMKSTFAMLDRFVEDGFGLIDTADVYSKWAPANAGGESETLIGKWLTRHGKRDELILATKVGGEMSRGRQGLSARYIATAVEQSLRRLHTDYIDLYQADCDDPATRPTETLEAFARLIIAGKVRVIGVSHYSLPRFKEALEVSDTYRLPRYETLQALYNLHDRQYFEQEVAPVCRGKAVSAINYYPIARDALTLDQRNRPYLTERGVRILTALDTVANQLEAKPAQIALAWLIAQPDVTAAIVTATSVQELNELLAAVRLRLDSNSLDLLNTASAYRL